MIDSALFWVAITLFCILTQGFYSMLEMAAVSFNRVRLEYYLSKGMKRAIWLHYLLQKPSRLFGTVMLGVNVALQVGSQSSREFYRAVHLDPSIAPFTQVILVVIIAELAPLFAARRYAEHVVMIGIPIVYATYRLLAPVIWIIGLITRFVARLFGSKDEAFDVFVSRDELKKILETHDEGVTEGEEFNVVVGNIFNLRNKTAVHVMTPLQNVEMIPSNGSVLQLRQRFTRSSKPFMPLFHKKRNHIVAIAFPKDLVHLSDNKSARECARPPWFITAQTKLVPILHQFRKNKQSVAVALDTSGTAVGILTLDDVLEEIFGQLETPTTMQKLLPLPLIERTFPGNMKISQFNHEYGANLDSEGVETLAQLMITHCDHIPKKGESVVIGRFEFTADETTLLAIKTLSIKSLD